MIDCAHTILGAWAAAASDLEVAWAVREDPAFAAEWFADRLDNGQKSYIRDRAPDAYDRFLSPAKWEANQP